MPIKSITTDEVTLTVAGNVPKKFPGGEMTDLTFGKQQAFTIYQDLARVFTEGTQDGFGTGHDDGSDQLRVHPTYPDCATCDGGGCGDCR